jgi:hypothetical protein
MVEKSKDGHALADMMRSLLFARRINIQGNALGDEFGTTIIAKKAKVVDVDIKEEAERLSSELEEIR